MISSKDFFVVIPARFDSSRFPGKVLEKINNISMLENVFNNAKKSKASAVYIATDSQKVYEASKKFTNNVYLTSSANNNGTERIAELAESLNWNHNFLASSPPSSIFSSLFVFFQLKGVYFYVSYR